jgi:hypothetical protein
MGTSKQLVIVAVIIGLIICIAVGYKAINAVYEKGFSDAYCSYLNGTLEKKIRLIYPDPIRTIIDTCPDCDKSNEQKTEQMVPMPVVPPNPLTKPSLIAPVR